MRFAHRTLSLHRTLPELSFWNKSKVNPTCEEAVKFVGFLWKRKEKQGEIQYLHRVEFN